MTLTMHLIMAIKVNEVEFIETHVYMCIWIYTYIFMYGEARKQKINVDI